jgi:hypothetical protein
MRISYVLKVNPDSRIDQRTSGTKTFRISINSTNFCGLPGVETVCLADYFQGQFGFVGVKVLVIYFDDWGKSNSNEYK